MFRPFSIADHDQMYVLGLQVFGYKSSGYIKLHWCNALLYMLYVIPVLGCAVI